MKTKQNTSFLYYDTRIRWYYKGGGSGRRGWWQCIILVQLLLHGGVLTTTHICSPVFSMTGFCYREKTYHFESNFGRHFKQQSTPQSQLVHIMTSALRRYKHPAHSSITKPSLYGLHCQNFPCFPSVKNTWQIARADDFHSLRPSRRKSIPFTTITFLSPVIRYGLPHIHPTSWCFPSCERLVSKANLGFHSWSW